MKKFFALIALSILVPLSAFASVTLEYCLAKAEENYPLIQIYGLVEKTSEISLSDINKSWLPRVGVYAQATLQNNVPAFPETLNNILAQLGQNPKGLGHAQYKVGVDLAQTIWDGGASKAQREIERASSAELQSEIAVKIYAVRERVMNLYFSVLLMDEQIAQTKNTLSLLQANLHTMKKMKEEGVAMQSDVDMIEAQALTLTQQLAGAESVAKSYREVLAVYVGESLEGQQFAKPDATMPANLESARPEFEMFKAKRTLNNARMSAIESTIMPKVGFFAQAWYGYPGLNNFASMINRDLSFNVLAGVKISWNIDSFYTKKNSRRKLAIANEGIDNDREMFQYNTRLQTSGQMAEIEGTQAVMKEDARIVALRGSVRQAAESQLRNGVIDATALLTKITDENQARLAASYHEIQLLQNIYKLKSTLNK